MARGVVVGTTSSVSADSCVVATLLAPQCRVGAKVEGADGTGIARGRHGGRMVCLLDYLDRDAEYKVGDTVATSGLSDVIPGGLPMGEVLPWEEGRTANIVNVSYAQLRIGVPIVVRDFRYVWVVCLAEASP
jgi:rod shape-determining protein MreC